MWTGRVDFELADDAVLHRLDSFARSLDGGKNAGAKAEDPLWPRLLSETELARLAWPPLAGPGVAAEDWRNWLASWMLDFGRYEREWVPRIPDPSRVAPGWDLLSLLDALLTGEYALLGCERTGGACTLRIDPWGWPYGGIAAPVALVEVFGGYVLGWDEGSGKYEKRRAGRFE